MEDTGGYVFLMFPPNGVMDREGLEPVITPHGYNIWHGRPSTSSGPELVRPAGRPGPRGAFFDLVTRIASDWSGPSKHRLQQ